MMMEAEAGAEIYREREIQSRERKLLLRRLSLRDAHKWRGREKGWLTTVLIAGEGI